MIENGTLPGQRTVRATLATLAARVAQLGLSGGPALVIVGEVAAFAGTREVAAVAEAHACAPR